MGTLTLPLGDESLDPLNQLLAEEEGNETAYIRGWEEDMNAVRETIIRSKPCTKQFTSS